ncbi:MAG: DUF4339 domain-containing protein [Pirellulales bacterium]
MPELQWYYARNDQPLGPVSAGELKQLAEAGELKPDDLLWREGMDEWTTAVNLRGLFGAAAGDKEGLAASVVQPRPADTPFRTRPPATPAAHARLRALVRATQGILWTTCVLVVLVGMVLFTRAFLQAQDAQQEAAAAAVFATFFIAAYVLARAGEKLSRLLLARARRR